MANLTYNLKLLLFFFLNLILSLSTIFVSKLNFFPSTTSEKFFSPASKLQKYQRNFQHGDTYCTCSLEKNFPISPIATTIIEIFQWDFFKFFLHSQSNSLNHHHSIWIYVYTTMYLYTLSHNSIEEILNEWKYWVWSFKFTFPLERAYIGTYDNIFFSFFHNSEEETTPTRFFSFFLVHSLHSHIFWFSSPPFESDDDAADSDMLLWVEWFHTVCWESEKSQARKWMS